MYFVDEGTEKCGFYECKKCSYRFLSVITEKKTACPLCEQDIDYEIGPGESLEDLLETAELLEVIEGTEASSAWMCCCLLPTWKTKHGYSRNVTA